MCSMKAEFESSMCLYFEKRQASLSPIRFRLHYPVSCPHFLPLKFNIHSRSEVVVLGGQEELVLSCIKRDYKPNPATAKTQFYT